jgi:hypothetical protein
MNHHKRIRVPLEVAEPFKIDGVYCRLIPLTHGRYSIVDATDYEWLMQWKWLAQWDPKKRDYYARRHQSYLGSRVVMVAMHRKILSVTADMHVDHRNGCGLDNRRKNLRSCTPSQNQHNRPTRSRANTSGYTGVSFEKKEKAWRASIGYNRRQLFLGYFATAELAARARDAKAVELFGDFAVVNLPVDKPEV